MKGNNSSPSISAATMGSKEQQINARIASLKNELDAAARSSAEPSSTMEQLQSDLKRRQESYIRRERQFEEKIHELEEEVNRLKGGRTSWMENDEKVRNIRDMHTQLMKNIATVKENTARVLQDQEKDLLRAFRARLFDIQSELEIEKSKADVGASAWIEKNRQLERGLDWAKEMADRLEKVNQGLQAENAKLKSQYKTQENDREFLIRQLVTVKKDNVQLRQELETKDDVIAKQQEEIDQLANFKKQTLRSSTTQSMNSPNAAPGRTGVLPPAVKQGSGDALYPGKIQSLSVLSEESETRYKEIIKRLKKLLETERQNLKKVRQAYSAEMQTHTELELLLRQCVHDVRSNISKQRRFANSSAHASTSSLRSLEESSLPLSSFESKEFEENDREKILELLLSQERVVTLLYKKTFPNSKTSPSNPVDISGLASFKKDLSQISSRSKSKLGETIDAGQSIQSNQSDLLPN